MGTLSAEGGSPTNPSVYGEQHRRTGLFWLADESLGIAIDGKAALQVCQTGIGIGAAPLQNPLVQLYVADDGGLLDSCYVRTAANGVGSGTSFHLQRCRGTIANPQIVQQGDLCGRFICDAYDGVQWDDVAAFRFEIDGVPSTSGVSGRIVFQTTPQDSFNLTEAFRIDCSQRTLFSKPAAPLSNGLTTLGYGGVGWKGLYLDYTNTATVGNVTINKPSGRAIIPSGASSVTITNSRVTAASRVMAVLSTNDATAGGIKSVVPSNGAVVVTTNGTTTVDTSVDWVLINAD